MESEIAVIKGEELRQTIRDEVSTQFDLFIRIIEEKIDDISDLYLLKEVFDQTDVCRYIRKNRIYTMRMIRLYAKREEDQGIPESKRAFQKKGDDWLIRKSILEDLRSKGLF